MREKVHIRMKVRKKEKEWKKVSKKMSYDE